MFHCPDCNRELTPYKSSFIFDDHPPPYYCRHDYGKYAVMYCCGWVNVYEDINEDINKDGIKIHFKNLILLDEERIKKLMLLQ